jgi:hypothetical protein
VHEQAYFHVSSASGRLRGLSTNVGSKRSRQPQSQEKPRKAKPISRKAMTHSLRLDGGETSSQGQNLAPHHWRLPRRCTISVIRSAQYVHALAV